MVSLSVKCSSGTTFEVEAELSMTVLEFKEKLVGHASTPAAQQRLIYKGRILRDESTLEHYGVEDKHTIHMVRGAAQPATPAPAPAAMGQASPFGGLGGFGGMGGGMAGGNFAQMQQQLMQNPDMMQSM